MDGNGLVFTNGKATVTRDLPESVTQRLTIKLNTFLAEWFLDLEYGIPYYESIFGKQRLKSTIDGIFQTKIKEDDDVLQILDFSSSISQDRIYSMSFRVVVSSGETTNQITIATGA